MNLAKFLAMNKLLGGSSGGGNDTLKQLTEDTLTEIVDNSVEFVGAYAFYNKTIEKVSFVNATTINNDAFSGCKKLKHINFPKVTSIKDSAFYNCSNLEDVNVPNVTALTGNRVFSGCSKLESICFPKPLASTFYTFSKCTNLKIVDFSCRYIGTETFKNCTSLKTIINRCESCATLSSISNFSSTPFAEGGTGGTVYVPQALIEEHQNATNWSTLYAAGTCNFVAIEGSEYE